MIIAKREVQNVGMADVRERGDRFRFDDWRDFPKEIAQGSHGSGDQEDSTLGKGVGEGMAMHVWRTAIESVCRQSREG